MNNLKCNQSYSSSINTSELHVNIPFLCILWHDTQDLIVFYLSYKCQTVSFYSTSIEHELETKYNLYASKASRKLKSIQKVWLNVAELIL